MANRKALVAGALAAKAGNGGHAWSRISLARGLRRLGFDVVFVEVLAEPTPEQSGHFHDVLSEFDTPGRLLTNESELRVVAGDATLLLNVGGHIADPEARSKIPVSIYLDDDPAYTQLWQAAGLLGDRLEGHTAHFTFGANIGRPGCSLPTNGIAWRPTAPPVVLSDWPAITIAGARFTTVASWRGGYGRVQWDGHLYGQKAHEFRKLVELPRRAHCDFEIALQIDNSDRDDQNLLR